MRVVLVLGRSTGGIGTHVRQLAADLRRLGHEVEVVTDSGTAARFGWTGARSWWPITPAGALQWLPRTRGLASGADVVHAHGLQAAGLVALALAGLRCRPRFVVSLHNPLPSVRGAGLARALVRRVIRSADLVTGASADLVALAAALGAARVELAPVPSPQVPLLLSQPVPSDEDRSREAGRLLGDDAARAMVLTISRIAPQKALEDVVEAARRMRTPVSWVVLGDGDADLLRELEHRADGTAVRFLGARKEVGSWLRASAVFVLPSRWEARALVVQEAMAAGTPVVATDVGGLSDLVGDDGLLVPPGDPDRLAQAVDELLGQPALRADLARRARDRAKGWDDGESTARRWAAWYVASGT